MKQYLMSALALLVSIPAYAQSPSADTGRWEVTRGSVALTGVQTMTATLPSSNSLANMLGYPARATLVVHCGEAKLDFYVTWPQVLAQDGTNFLGEPKTMAAWPAWRMEGAGAGRDLRPCRYRQRREGGRLRLRGEAREMKGPYRPITGSAGMVGRMGRERS